MRTKIKFGYLLLTIYLLLLFLVLIYQVII